MSGSAHPRRLLVAGALSLVPGVGHLYVGAPLRGLFLLLLDLLGVVALGMSGELFHARGLALMMLLLAGLLPLAAIDAMLLARRRRDYELREYNHWYVYLAAAFVISWAFPLAVRGIVQWQGLMSVRQLGQRMDPLIADHDRAFVNTRYYRRAIPLPGDIVVVRNPAHPDELHMVRVVAVGGDRVAMRGGRLFRNGIEMEESYARGLQAAEKTGNLAELRVPGDGVFVLSDHRDLGPDSRAWGSVARDLLVGKVALIMRVDNTLVDLEPS